jgi:predicted GH43/DUF377 family glycosyl hydrolase
MVLINKEGILLSRTGLHFEDEGVLNPAVIRDGDNVHLIYRAVSKGNFSSLGYCLLHGPLHVEERMMTPILFSQFEYERHGVEDPRIVRIDETYYLTYTAYDGVNALGALAISTDLIHFEKIGIIVPQVSYDEFKRLAACQNPINEKYSRFNDRNHLLTVPDKSILVLGQESDFLSEAYQG